MSTETIYQSLYVQSRGALKQELTRYLRTGRGLRHRSRKVGQRNNRNPNIINIAERPPKASDRAVPGSWEGDLIIGAPNLSAIGTLVERHSNFTMLVHLPCSCVQNVSRPAAVAAPRGAGSQCFQARPPYQNGRDGGSRTRSAAGYEPEPGAARIAAMPSTLNASHTDRSVHVRACPTVTTCDATAGREQPAVAASVINARRA